MSTATDRDHGGPSVAPRTGGRPDRALTWLGAWLEGRIGGRIGGRRHYVPTVVIAVAVAWLGWPGWPGWSELSEFGVARSIDASRFQLAGPVVLGFVLVVFLIEQAFPATAAGPRARRGHVLPAGLRAGRGAADRAHRLGVLH